MADEPRDFLDFLRKQSKGAQVAGAPASTPETPLAGQSWRQEPQASRDPGHHFGLIVTVLISFSVVTGLIGFVLGKKLGFSAGWERGIGVRTESALPDAAGSAAAPAPVQRETLVSQRRVEPKPMKIQAGPADGGGSAFPTAKFTLQIQTLGPGHAEETRDLVASLKQAGFEAFADHRDGIIYVGRFDSPSTAEVKRIKNELARFEWRKRNFSRCFLTNIPK